ncbi:hypothetical protein BGW41_004032 [Actinomortierella wolfii]|nr:hypothetical protein BGW41_004032 [Actinomortierella wolfii]
MRYMLERGLYLASLLNRTLIIPTHLRIRHCADHATCLQVASRLQLDRIGHNPQGSIMELDMGYFFDLPHLERYQHGQKPLHVLDFKTFMEKVIGVPDGSPLIDSEYVGQIACWQEILKKHGDSDNIEVSFDGKFADGFDGYVAKSHNDDDDDDDDDGDDDGDGDGDDEDEKNDHGEDEEELSEDEKDQVEEASSTGQSSDEQSHHREIILENQQSPILYRFKRLNWDLPSRPDTTFIDDLVRNVLVDTIPELERDTSLQNSNHNRDAKVARHEEDGTERRVQKTFFAFSDVRGGGLYSIVNWSVELQLDIPPLASSSSSPSSQRSRRRHHPRHLYVPKPDLATCQPPVEDPSASRIPWEARFPAFATCKIVNYVGLSQELATVQERILGIEGQFHITGWIPFAFASRENAERYRELSVKSLKYAPVVHEAVAYLLTRLKEKMIGSDEVEVVEDYAATSTTTVRKWFKLAMHVRRGDFVTEKYGWQDFGNAWMQARVKDAVRSAGLLHDEGDEYQEQQPSSFRDRNEEVDPLPGEAQQTVIHNIRHHSHQNNSVFRPTFFLATDEASPQMLAYFRSLGAVLIDDLLDDHFRSRYSHLIVFQDWMGLVEQLLCSEADKFVGTMSSSFSSGIINRRVVELGMDHDQHSGYLVQEGGPLLAS